MFNVKPFKEVLALTTEKLDEALAPIRARAAQAKACLETAKIEEELISLESEIHKLCAEKELNFSNIVSKIDAYELKERKLSQIKGLVERLFPESVKGA
jgi:hypothetical protein